MPTNKQPSFSYRITRTKRKSVALYVREQDVEVRAPHFVGNREINDWVNSKSDWIEQRLQQQLQKSHQRPKIQHNSTLLFMGVERTIKIIAGKNQVIEDHEQLIIHSRTPDNSEKNQALIERWLKNEAQQYIDTRCIELAKTMEINQQISAIKYRKTRSKWGHCTSTGILQFNWLIIMAPVEVIDYLLIHELSHLTHMNHSKQFWQRVAEFCPQYRQHKKWLNEQGHRITL